MIGRGWKNEEAVSENWRTGKKLLWKDGKAVRK